MPYIQYIERNFSARSRETIDNANVIITEYQRQGYSLTLRQLYYQFVARDLIPNEQREYNRLGSVVNDARLAGEIDWSSIEDRTRGVTNWQHWDSPATIISDGAERFEIDKWARQPWSVEVWIEKEALAGVFERVCAELDVPYLSCRGYTSQSEMWRAAQRLIDASDEGRETMILHFGDHDPSGIDMTRDIIDRLALFGARVKVDRLALNMDQVDEYEPPPNPAKVTDSRFDGYMRKFGDESWELDALEPRALADLARSAIVAVQDEELWDEAVEEEAEGRKQLAAIADQWSAVVSMVGGAKGEP